MYRRAYLAYRCQLFATHYAEMGALEIEDEEDETIQAVGVLQVVDAVSGGAPVGVSIEKVDAVPDLVAVHAQRAQAGAAKRGCQWAPLQGGSIRGSVHPCRTATTPTPCSCCAPQIGELDTRKNATHACGRRRLDALAFECQPHSALAQLPVQVQGDRVESLHLRDMLAYRRHVTARHRTGHALRESGLRDRGKRAAHQRDQGLHGGLLG